MTKRERTKDELVVEWLSDDVQDALKRKGFKLRHLKLKFTGLAWLLVVGVEHDGTAFVGFVGGGSITSVARKLRKHIKDDDLKLKIDDWAEGD